MVTVGRAATRTRRSSALLGAVLLLATVAAHIALCLGHAAGDGTTASGPSAVAIQAPAEPGHPAHSHHAPEDCCAPAETVGAGWTIRFDLLLALAALAMLLAGTGAIGSTPRPPLGPGPLHRGRRHLWRPLPLLLCVSRT